MNKSHTIIIIIYIHRKVLIKFAKQYKLFIWNLTLIYLKNERKWNYTFKPSSKTINEIINVLNQLLKAAIKWNLLDNDYNCIVKEKLSEKERTNLTELQNQINNFQKIRITNSLDKIFE